MVYCYMMCSSFSSSPHSPHDQITSSLALSYFMLSAAPLPWLSSSQQGVRCCLSTKWSDRGDQIGPFSLTIWSCIPLYFWSRERSRKIGDHRWWVIDNTTLCCSLPPIRRLWRLSPSQIARKWDFLRSLDSKHERKSLLKLSSTATEIPAWYNCWNVYW